MSTLHKKLPGSNQSTKNGLLGGGNIKSLTKNFRTLLLEEGNFNAKFANYKKAKNDKGFIFELHGETEAGTLFKCFFRLTEKNSNAIAYSEFLEDFGDYEIDAIIGKEVNITIEEADNGFYNITHIEKI